MTNLLCNVHADHFDFQSRTPEPFSASSLRTPYSFKGPAKLYEVIPTCKIRPKSPRQTTPLTTAPFFRASAVVLFFAWDGGCSRGNSDVCCSVTSPESTDECGCDRGRPRQTLP